MATGDAEDGVETPHARPEGSGRKPPEQGMGASSATARSAHSRPEANVRLMELVVSRENMMAAHARVVGNKGAAGIDKMSVADLKPFLKEHGSASEKSCWKTGISHNPCAGWRSPSPGAGCAYSASRRRWTG